MTRVLRIAFILLCSCLFLVGTGYLTLIFILCSNGVTFSDEEFHFPFHITVKNIRIDVQDLKASADYFEIDLHPAALLRGHIEGDHLELKNGTIEITTTDTTDSSTPLNLRDIIPIKFNSVLLSNIHLRNISGKNTLSIKVPEFYVGQLNLGKTWQIDTVINKGTSIEWLSNTPKSDEPPNKRADTTNDFIFPDIPEFTIKNVVFNECRFEIHSATQNHSFKHFNLALSSNKDPENIAMSVNNFSLTYQDTLQVELTLDKILINKKEEVRISNLAFDLPGLQLKIPKLELSNPGSPKAHLQLAESIVNTSLLKLFSPKTKLPFTRETEIRFYGDLTLKDNTFSLKNLSLKLEEKTGVTINGLADLPGKKHAGANIKISKLYTNTTALKDLFGIEPFAQQKEIAVHSSFNISGPYNQLEAKGTLDLNQSKTSFQASIDLRNKKKTELTLDLRSRHFDSRQLFTSTETNVVVSNFRLSSQTTLYSNNKLSGLALRINSDSIRINENTLSLPEVKAYYTPQHATASINLPDLLKLTISSSDNLLGNKINYSGNLQSIVPKLNNLQEKAGELAANFNGQFNKEGASFDFLLDMDTILVSTLLNKHEYSTTGLLNLSSAENGDLHANLLLNGEEIIDFKTTGDFTAWWSDENKWKKDYPVTELELAFSIDSNLLEDLTGRRGMIQFDNLHLAAEGKEIDANLEISNLLLDTFHLKDLKLRFESHQQVMDGQLTIANFENPYATIQDVNILLTQKNDQTFGIAFNTFLPEVDNKIEINTTITNQNNSYIINLNENDLVLGDFIWKNENSQGFLVDEHFELVSGDLTILNGVQRINVETSGEIIALKIDSLHLHPLVELVTKDTTTFGDLNLIATYNVEDELLKWEGAIQNIAIKNQPLGNFNFDGNFRKDLMAHFSIHENYGYFDLTLHQIDSTLKYDLGIRNLDLAYVNAALPWKEMATVSGKINASVEGEFDNTPVSHGYIHFDRFESYLTENKIYLKVDADTLWFNGSHIAANNFRIYDKKEHPLVLNGKFEFSGQSEINLRATTQAFTVLDTKGSKNKIKGNVEISSDLTLIRTKEKFEIKGNLNVLPNSSISYLYESSVSLDEREKEIAFVSFDELDHPGNDSIRTRLKRRTNPLEWDVKLGVGKSDISILLSETYQDNIKMTAQGDFLLKTGSTDEPFFFGNLKSTEGNIVYDAPMVSDVDLDIENLLVTWSGELSKTRITFAGSEMFRIVPRGIPGMANTTSVVPVSVLVKIKDSPINDFQLAFDLNSTDAKVKSWIQSLPEDTREENAINLLLFGTLNFGETSSSGYMQSIAAKMNELSRRNIKSADLTFYTESDNVSETTSSTQEKLGYNFSKGLFNKNVKVSFGGTLDFGNSTQSTERKSSALSNLQLEYILSKSPDVSMTLAQKTIYDGIINGEVGESSFGISYLKRFRNFFKLPEKK